jgi:hypothetical protein
VIIIYGLCEKRYDIITGTPTTEVIREKKKQEAIYFKHNLTQLTTHGL